MTKIFVWSDSDLDGAGSILALKWLYESKVQPIRFEHESVWNGQDLSQKMSKWFEQNYDKYDKIYICDLSLAENVIEIVDKQNVVVIDHHKTHVDLKHQYTIAKTIIFEHTSTTDIIRTKFHLDDNITSAQKELLIRIDDYDQYMLKYPESIKLNAIHKKVKTKKFIEQFDTGLRSFNIQERSIINLFSNELKTQLNNTQYFVGNILGYKAVACYVERYSSETSNIVLNRYNADICFAVNLSKKSVSIRKTKKCPLKLNVLAEKFCNGGGHEFAAAGKLTENFAKLLKNFKEVK
jgi:nanoRNase/pAp phosphatase (c-di-AMP/oligoRNAs hydrolase)